jgi:hypothetical protein
MNRRAGAGIFAAVLLSLLAAVPRSAEAQDDASEQPLYWQGNPNIGLGLFQSVSLSPFASFRIGLGPHLPSSLAEDGIELRVNEDWARVLSVQDQWLLDYDVLRSNVGVSWGVTNDLRLNLDFETATRTSGYLETFIIGFHRTFGLSLAERRKYQHHPQTILIEPPKGGPPVLIDQHDQQPYAQSLIASADYAILRGGEDLPDVHTSLQLRGAFHTGDVTGGSPIDVGGSIAVSKGLGPVNLYVAASVAWYGSEDLHGLPLRPLQSSGLWGFEIRFVDWFSVTAQWLITSGGADGLNDLSKPSHEVTAGFKWDLGRGFLLETAILENIINPFNSPDFGVHFSLTVRW